MTYTTREAAYLSGLTADAFMARAERRGLVGEKRGAMRFWTQEQVDEIAKERPAFGHKPKEEVADAGS